MSVSLLLMVLISLFGGGSDLLDYIPTDNYWQTKNVDVNVANMSKELESPDVSNLITQLSSDDPQVRGQAKQKLSQLGMAVLRPLQEAANNSDPEVASAAEDLISQIAAQSKTIAVRRLMAIRALGELGDPRGEAELKPLLNSPEVFEADYAAAAVAAIEHKPYSRPVPTDAQRISDAWNLPADDDAVIQFCNTGQTPASLSNILGYITLIPRLQRGPMVRQFSQEFIHLAEAVGNFRLEAVTLSFPDPVPNGQWNFAVVLRGEYDAGAVTAALVRDHIPSEKIAGQQYFQLPSLGFFMPDDQRMAFVVGLNFNRRQPVLRAVMSGQKTLHDSPLVAPLIEAAAKKAPIWGVMHVTPGVCAQIPWLGPINTIGVQSTQAADHLEVHITAAGDNPTGVAKSADDVQTSLQNLGRRLNPNRAAMMSPMDRTIVGLIQSVHCAADGLRATVGAQIPTPTIPTPDNP